MRTLRRACVLWSVIGVVAGALDARQQSPRSSAPTATQPASKDHSKTFDAGEVSLDQGPALVEHDFRLLNPTDKAVEVVEIIPTCGCLKAALDKHRIEPGQVATLHMAQEILASGELVHGATLMLADGTSMAYRLRTVGVVSLIFSVIAHDPVLRRADHDRRLPVRFLVVDSKEDGLEAPPIFEGPPGVNFYFDGWTYLERRSSMPLRPTRQVGGGILDFSKYSGPFPVTVSFRTPRGPPGRMQVFEDPPVGP